jgi:hypothetical protein
MMKNCLPKMITLIDIYNFIEFNSRLVAHGRRNRAMFCLRAHAGLRMRDIADMSVNQVLSVDMTLRTKFVSAHDGKAVHLDEHTQHELTSYLCALYQIECLADFPICRFFDVMFKTSKREKFTISTLCQHFCLQDKSIRDFDQALRSPANAQNRSFQRLFLKSNRNVDADHKKRSKSVLMLD